MAQIKEDNSYLSKWLKKNRSLVLRQTPVWAQSLAVIVLSLGSISLVGSYFFKIDEVVTVTGRLQSSQGSRDVQSPVGGKVHETKVKDGDKVAKGDLLLVFDTREALQKQKTLSELISLENNELESRLEILKGRKRVYSQKILTQSNLLSESKKLLDIGAFQKVTYLEQEDRLLELQNELTAIDLEIKRNRLSTEKSLSQLKSDLNSVELQLQNQNVVAPTSGIVFQSQASKDAVLTAGSTILTIVPQEGLKAKVYVNNKDIGFVERGQTIKLRVDAFPYTTYGELEGNITNVGADVLPPDQDSPLYKFPVDISLKTHNLKRNNVVIPLQSGMAVTGNIKLREKRVIFLISDMFVQQADSVRSIRQ